MPSDAEQLSRATDFLIRTHRTTIIDSFSCILVFKLGYALFYQFYAEFRTFSIKKCSVQLLSTTPWYKTEISCIPDKVFPQFSPVLTNLILRNLIHVGLFETYRYKRTGQFFIWNYIGNCFFFFFCLNISIFIADINTVQTTLCSEISSLHFDLFFKIFCQKKDVAFCETTDTAHSYINTDSKFFGNQCVYRCLKWSH